MTDKYKKYLPIIKIAILEIDGKVVSMKDWMDDIYIRSRNESPKYVIHSKPPFTGEDADIVVKLEIGQKITLKSREIKRMC